MNKKLLFLYPIEEYWINNFPFLNEKNIRKLEATIDIRYRQKGYEIFYALFPNREISHITPIPSDKVALVDTEFFEGFKYPSTRKLLKQLGETEQLVVCGFHKNDCVYRTAQGALKQGFNTLVDLELTEGFAYRSSKFYFDPEEYNLANIVVDEMHEIHKYYPYLANGTKKFTEEFYHLKDFVPTITEEDVEKHEQDPETLFIEYSYPR